MAHEFESGFMVREKAWHGLGTIVQEAPTSLDALRLAGLDWKVEQKPLFCEGKQIDKYVANVRDKDGAVLGVVTGRYSIVQNDKAFDFTDNLIGDEVRYETAGSLRGGRTVWLLAKMPTDKILGDDIDPYLCFTNSHDGMGAIKVCMTPVRVVCNNTLNAALKTAKRSWSAKHLGNIDDKLDEARRTLQLANKYMDALKKEADILANTKITDVQFDEFLTKLVKMPDDPTDRQKRNAETIKEGITICYLAPDIMKFRNTKYGVLNAVADYVDHSVPLRVTAGYQENLFERVINGHELFDNAMDLLR